MRRLTVREYDNTIRDILGVESAPAARLIDDERGVVSADARRMSPLLAEQYMLAAEEIGDFIASDSAGVRDLTGCEERTSACAHEWIADFAPIAYRHPQSEEELAPLVSLFDAAMDLTGSFDEAIGLTLKAVLQSPRFLFRLELAPSSEGEIVELDDHQLATRLSYFLISAPPDATLRAAADAGELADRERLEEEARRLVESPRAHETVRLFFSDLMELEHIDDLEKDPATYPDFGSNTADLMRRETEAFVEHVVFEGDGSWRTLLTAPWTMMNADLAEYYGVSGPSGEDFERVDLDSAHHSGILTHGSLLAIRARPYETSPVHRGMFIRGSILCGVVPDVPEGLNVTPPELDESRTTRERLAAHRANPVCASCHRQLDPLGFAFEHFDGAGRFRETENGLAIDASGEMVDSDIDGNFDGAAELGARLVESAQAQNCFTDRFFLQAHGRSIEDGDACSVLSLREAFVASDFNIRELLVQLALTDSFRHRPGYAHP